MADILSKYLERFTNLGPLGLTIVFLGGMFYTITFLLLGPENASPGFLLGFLVPAVAFNSTIKQQNTEPYETSLNMVFWTLTAIIFSALLIYSIVAIPFQLPFGNIWIYTTILIANYIVALKSAT